jgi:hypothetical protein
VAKVEAEMKVMAAATVEAEAEAANANTCIITVAVNMTNIIIEEASTHNICCIFVYQILMIT